MIFCKTNVLNPYKREVLAVHKYDRLIDFLQDEYPEGFSVPTDIHIGTKKIEVDDYDTALNENDIVILLERPAVPVAFAGALFAFLANTAISFALSYVVNRIFAPETPDQTNQQQNQASTVYNLNNSQNLAKLGGVVPVIYGTVRMYPSMITQPYFRYTGNDEYLQHLLCIGHGRYNIDRFLIDNQDIYDSVDVEFKLITLENFSDIEGFIDDHTYTQLTNTLSSPSQLELGGFWATNVDMNFANKTINVSQEIIVYAGDKITIAENTGGGQVPLNSGTYTVVSSTINDGITSIIVTASLVADYGNFFIYSPSTTELYEVSGNISYIEIDYTYPYGLYNSDTNGAFYTYSETLALYTYDENRNFINSYNVSNSGTSNNPIRKSQRYQIPNNARYVSFYRKYGKSTNTTANNTLFITRVKELYPQPDLTDIGDLTLLWVKIKATNAISSIGQTQVNGFFTRTDVPNDLRSVLEDVYTNESYGGRLPIADLDFIDTTETVNCAFDMQSTIWDALKLVSKSQKYTVYPVGQELLLKYDDVNNVNSALFNETNIIKDSLKVQYAFKEENASSDSIECTYRTGEDWNAEKVQYPTDGLYPATVELFGVTETAQAEKMAKYLYKQEQARIKIVTFDTDIQGLVPQFLDKVLISHSSMLWGTAGEVYEVTGTTIELSEPVLGWVDTTATTTVAMPTATSYNITFRNVDGSISETLPYTIISEYVISVPLLPNWVTEGTFYTNGEPREYLVTKITPKGEKVSIECVNYDAEVYT